MSAVRKAGWLAALVALIGGTASAQDHLLRRELATPGLVVETGMRVGGLDALAFTPDGKYLLASGDDKVVRSWKLADGKLDTIPAAAGEPLSVLRWPSMRELRGSIYALAVSPRDNRLVAVGGVGLKDSQLALIDRFDGDVKAILPTVHKESQPFSIFSLAFSPSGGATGRRLARWFAATRTWLVSS